MCVPTEDISRTTVSRQTQGTVCDLDRQPFPMRMQFIDQSWQPVLQEANLLKPDVELGRHAAEERRAASPQVVELMSMNGEAPMSVPFPFVLQINLDTQQVFHHVGDARVMIALNPHHFDAALRIAELANVADELPVLLGEAGKIEIAEDVAQQYEPFVGRILKKIQQVGCEAEIGAEMHVRHDQGFAIHLY